jgi:hypothetical protein
LATNYNKGLEDNLPFYEMIAEEKMPDTDVLKEMIMNSLKNNPILNSESVQSISPMGYNMRGRGRTVMSGRDLAAYEAAMANSQTGRSINDKDLALHREMLLVEVCLM